MKRLLGFSTAALILTSWACGGGSSTPPPAATQAQEGPSPATAPAVAAPTAAPAPGGTSAVSGVLTYAGQVPTLKPLQMDADPGCAKKHSGPVENEALVLGEGNTLGNVFVRVKSGLPPGSYPVPAEPVTLDQNGCRYSPHVLGLMVGQPFRVLNSDGLLHNVHAMPQVNKPFNRAMPANVTEATYVFDKEEVMFKIKCDVHPWMGAYLGVLPHPYFDVTGKDGAYNLANLPAGSYELEAWHEKLGTQTLNVTLAAGETKSLDWTFKQ